MSDRLDDDIQSGLEHLPMASLPQHDGAPREPELLKMHRDAWGDGYSEADIHATWEDIEKAYAEFNIRHPEALRLALRALRHSAIPRSRKPIKARGRKPDRRAGACRPYLDWLKEQCCVILGVQTGAFFAAPPCEWIVVDPAHVRVKKLGGDLNNAISLAHHLHHELHQRGIKTFAKKYGVDLAELARQQTEQWLATPEGQAWASDPGGGAS
jgi:hypothetical protein